MTTHKQQEGFTLVELSIVLVIIGLIVSGVLVGQDLIKAAEIRSTVGQMESYDSAVNTFNSKFGGLPGDIANPEELPLEDGDWAGTAGLGDGNRLIEHDPGSCTAGATEYTGEPAMFWRHLSDAGILGAPIDGPDYSTAAVTADVLDAHMVQADIGRNNRFHIGSDIGRNYYAIGGVSAVAGCTLTSADRLTPLEARQIDEKMDDSLPTSGIVQAVDDINDLSITTPAAPATGVCVDNTDPNNLIYSASTEEFSNGLSCQIRARASF